MTPPARIYIAPPDTIYNNLAREEYLVRRVKENEQILFIWQSLDCVVLGRNQCPAAECNLQYLQQKHIALARRASGGGTVFQDRGNINFTFLARAEYAVLPEYNQILNRVFKQIHSEIQQTERKDFCWRGRKFSGNAFFNRCGVRGHHGTAMISVDLQKLYSCLQSDETAVQNKAVRSVRSPVVNLQEINSQLTQSVLVESFIQAFGDVFGPVSVKEFDRLTPQMEQYSSIYQTQEWIWHRLGLEKLL